MTAAVIRSRLGGIDDDARVRPPEEATRIVELDPAIRAAIAGARESRRDASAEQDWGETLQMVHRASDLLRAAEERVRELEASNRDLAERAAMQAEALQGRLLQAQVRADEAEQRRKEAEEWLRRIHGAIVENLGV
jgi:hypothetical protein